MYILNIPVFWSQVYIMSKTNPMDSMSIICFIKSDDVKKYAINTANNDVSDMVNPVLRLPSVLSNIVPSFLVSTLDVNSMSVSTEYPIIIRNAATPPRLNLISNKDTTASVDVMSENAVNITINAGTKLLNVMKTTIPIDMNANIIAVIICL